MFDQNSRYKDIKVATTMVPGPDGEPREVRFIYRRFLPHAESLPTLDTLTVTQADRMDLIASRFFGDPTQWWRLCDANAVMNPSDLLEPGEQIRIPGANGWQ